MVGPEREQVGDRRVRRVGSGGVPDARPRGDAGTESLGGRRLQCRRPDVVAIAEGDQHREAEGVQLVGAVGLGEQLLGHPQHPDRVVGDEPVVQPRLDLGRRRVGLGLRLDLALGDPDGLQVHHRQDLGEQRDRLVRRSRDGGRPGAHQGQRPQGGGVGQRRRTGDQATERVADQVRRRPERGEHREDVVGQHLEVVRRGVAVAGSLELAALVQRHRPVPGGRDRRQHGDEVLLRAGISGHQQDRCAGLLGRLGARARPARHAGSAGGSPARPRAARGTAACSWCGTLPGGT